MIHSTYHDTSSLDAAIGWGHEKQMYETSKTHWKGFPLLVQIDFFVAMYTRDHVLISILVQRRRCSPLMRVVLVMTWHSSASSSPPLQKITAILTQMEVVVLRIPKQHQTTDEMYEC